MREEKNTYLNKIKKGVNIEIIKEISSFNDEPEWMLELRLEAFEIFKKMNLPNWGPDLLNLNLENIYYFASPKGASDYNSWDQVPEDLKYTFERLGIPEAERLYLSGVGAQMDSQVVYHSIKQEYKDKGVVFMDMNSALKDKKIEPFVKKYFSKLITLGDHKFSALHYAVWSGGTFLYVPKGVILDEPLQSYFRMNKMQGGQFEHTLIILEDNSEAHYIEGCSAPKYDKNSLHAGGVEIFVGKNAKMRYSSVENWSKDTYNLNTKRSILDDGAYIDWVGGNMGSGTTMLYPCSILKGDNSSCRHLGIAYANSGQNQDTGVKVIHIGKNTSSIVKSKSISKGNGVTTFRGLIDVKKGAIKSIISMDCDGLIIGEEGVNNALPTIKVGNSTSTVAHEATSGKINDEFLYYLNTRGISKNEATALIVNGFLSSIIDELPLEYASEMNILIGMEFEGGF